MPAQDLFKNELKVINVGLSSFKENLDHNQTEVVHVDWKPPLEVDLNAKQIIDKNNHKIQEANKQVLSLILNAKPMAKLIRKKHKNPKYLKQFRVN